MHGSFKQIINNHQRQCGCPECYNKSKGEERIKNWLEKNGYILNENYFREQKFDSLRSGKGYDDHLKFDFYIPEKNTVIEFQGLLHFFYKERFGGEEKLKLQQKYDQMKRDWCKENGLQELEINYKDFKNIENILSSYFV